MSERICPVCGREEKDPTALFCDLDGASLIEKKAYVQETQIRKVSLFESIPWGILLGIIGFAFMVAAIWLALDAEKGSLELGKTKISLTSKKSSDNSEGSKKDEQIKSQKFASTNALLKRCFGKVPALPRRKGDSAADSFELLKDVMQTGQNVLVENTTDELSVEEERRLGRKMINEMKKEFGLSADKTERARVQKITARLTPLTTRGAELNYQIKIFDSKDVNAFMGPGGKGAVFLGLAKLLKDDDALASVIGHELAHSEMGHSANVARVAMAGKKMGQILSPSSGELGERLSGFTTRMMEITYDQDKEYEADRLGLCLSHLAGFDPSGGVAALKALRRDARKRGHKERELRTNEQKIAYDIVSSHPPLSERISYQKQLVKKLR